jgi:PEP-CTERM motif
MKDQTIPAQYSDAGWPIISDNGLAHPAQANGLGRASLGAFFAVGAVSMFFLNATQNYAQGTLTVLQTGNGQPLISDQVTLQTAGVSSPVIDFDFGFATDETVSPGTLLDSFTVSLTDVSSDAGTVVTSDASGTYWQPSTPGGYTFSPNAIQWQAITPPSGSPIFGSGVAYAVQVSLPPAFDGATITADFDLFYNGNSSATAMGWFQNVQAVPEPSSVVLMTLGVVTFLVRRKFSR